MDQQDEGDKEAVGRGLVGDSGREHEGRHGMGSSRPEKCWG